MVLQQHIKWFCFTLCFLVYGSLLFAQNDNRPEKTLEERVTINRNEIRTDPEKAFLETDQLLELAIQANNTEAELKLLDTRCQYYLQKMDLENQVSSARRLLDRATHINFPTIRAKAHLYLMDAYTRNKLYNKVDDEYNQALSILEKQDPFDPKVITVKANLYIASANLYTTREMPEKAVQQFTNAYKEHSKYPKEEQKRIAFYHDYSNLASAYLEVNMDSAEYYVKKSVELAPRDSEDIFTFKNYGVWGAVYYENKDYLPALQYFLKAEELSEKLGVPVNREIVYEDLIKTYSALNDNENAEKYRKKLMDIQLTFEQQKNKSMQQIIENTQDEKKSDIFPIAAIIVLLLIIPAFFYFKKTKKEEEQAKKEITKEEFDHYNTLIAMLKNNDPAFLFTFEKLFPDFIDKLRKINPVLTQNEVDFCALLKLNLTTKEISMIKNLSPKTVQNRKNKIRKRLDIPNESDIYNWFNGL